MILTERRTDRGLLVTVCDRGLLGETFEDGAVTLSVTEEFYGGEPADPEVVIEALSRATVANLVGEATVELAVEEGFVDEENVLEVEETLHAQYLQL
jgi:hypothetical protein